MALIENGYNALRSKLEYDQEIKKKLRSLINDIKCHSDYKAKHVSPLNDTFTIGIFNGSLSKECIKVG